MKHKLEGINSSLEDTEWSGLRDKGAENLFKENFSNLGEETDIHIQEALAASDKMKPSRSTQRHNN